MGYKVMLAVDGSVHADYAVQWYLTNIHHPGYDVVLAHVAETEITPAFAFRAGIAIPREEWQMMVKEAEDKIKKLHQKHTETLKQGGVEHIKCVAETGNPGPHLVDMAEKNHCQMIVIGTRGLGSLARTILGSVSDYVLHHAHIPVCICRMPDVSPFQQQPGATSPESTNF